MNSNGVNPPIEMEPLVGSNIPKSKSTKVVLPDPEGPTIATVWPDSILRVKVSRASLFELGYLNLTSSNLTEFFTPE